MVHDWEFDVHHTGSSPKSFEAVRDTIAEAIKTPGFSFVEVLRHRPIYSRRQSAASALRVRDPAGLRRQTPGLIYRRTTTRGAAGTREGICEPDRPGEWGGFRPFRRPARSGYHRPSPAHR